MSYKTTNFEIKQIGDESERTLRFIGSDETPDRDNDIIEAAGWKLDNYIKNPVFLWAHSHDDLPVGKSVNVEIDPLMKRLVFDVKFPTPEEYPFADTVYRLYKGGYLNATSVGFRGLKHKIRDDESVLQLPDWQRGRRYMEQELFELSAVPVPANPNALVTVRGKGFKDDDIAKIFIDEDEEKTVIPYKKYATADESETWDGPAEISAASVDDLKIMCAWYDSDNADVKQSYKLPHHNQDGYATVWRAVTAAMGAFLGARGGVQIPDADRKGVYNHLSKHYADFDKEPPEFKEYTAEEIKSMFPEQEKSGATISAANREVLESIHKDMKSCHDVMKACNDRLKKFMDDNMSCDHGSGQVDDPMYEACASANMSLNFEEIKQALGEIKSQVLSLCEKQKKAIKDIDLAAIEWPKTEKTVAHNEPEIELGALTKTISEIIQNQLANGGKSI